ncbi:unnamed protein product [Lactuca saligna]|uniref:Uncharacterized protein n=1 Tax=Lactuca saligna TaxID=75948 RepID=A0AA35V4P6_LACSI|nr:unnamed protein product [Lactuca saligna]
MDEEILKETIPMKIGVLKRTQKPTKKYSESPVQTTTQEPIVKIVEPKVHNNESIVTSTFTTSIALPPPSSPIPTFVPVSTISPTFSGIMQEPIATIFSSQSTKKSQHENETNDEDVMVSFVDLQFDLEEENILDEMTMLEKQFKI